MVIVMVFGNLTAMFMNRAQNYSLQSTRAAMTE